MQTQIESWKQGILRNPSRLHEEDIVIRKYGEMFHPKNLEKLTKEDFKSFLLIRNNRHWDGIHRQGNLITSDMEKLKKALSILLDESMDIRERLDILFPHKKENYIKGMWKAIATPILLVVYPQTYGVWNNISEAGLKALDQFPTFTGKHSFADRYTKINAVLQSLASEHSITLWQLDEILGSIVSGNAITPYEYIEDSESEDESSDVPKTEEDSKEFALEKQLQSFLIENWSNLEFGSTHAILEEDGYLVGGQYPTSVGIIDILAKSKDGKEWLVIELKKGKSSDQVVGQILRYIGWVKKEKAAQGETVRGLIILGTDDERIRYAVSSLPDIYVMKYTVEFALTKAEE